MSSYLIVSAALFSIGLYGVLARRNILVMLMSVELMLNAANVAALAFARFNANMHGHLFFLMIMAVAAAEVGVGLSIVIALFRKKKSVDIADMTALKG
jgi:NADH:ubiquinone oxidoreductase subunit K